MELITITDLEQEYTRTSTTPTSRVQIVLSEEIVKRGAFAVVLITGGMNPRVVLRFLLVQKVIVATSPQISTAVGTIGLETCADNVLTTPPSR